MAHVNRDQVGLDLQSFVEASTGWATGYITAPPSARGDTPVLPYLVVTPHPGALGGQGTFADPAAGASLHFDVQAVGQVDRQVADALDSAVTAITGRVDGVYTAVWTGTQEPQERLLVGYGQPGKDDQVGLRWSSVEIMLVVML